MKVICIKNKCAEVFLTEGKIYDVISKTDNKIFVKNDCGGEDISFCASRFQFIKEEKPQTRALDPTKAYQPIQQPLDHETFLQQYILNRAATITDDYDPMGAAEAAEEAWQFIQKAIK